MANGNIKGICPICNASPKCRTSSAGIPRCQRKPTDSRFNTMHDGRRFGDVGEPLGIDGANRLRIKPSVLAREAELFKDLKNHNLQIVLVRV